MSVGNHSKLQVSCHLATYHFIQGFHHGSFASHAAPLERRISVQAICSFIQVVALANYPRLSQAAVQKRAYRRLTTHAWTTTKGYMHKIIEIRSLIQWKSCFKSPTCYPHRMRTSETWMTPHQRDAIANPSNQPNRACKVDVKCFSLSLSSPHTTHSQTQ